MKTDENYEPYGEEWEKEVMKLPKKVIVYMYKIVCQELKFKKIMLEKMYDEQK